MSVEALPKTKFASRRRDIVASLTTIGTIVVLTADGDVAVAGRGVIAGDAICGAQAVSATHMSSNRILSIKRFFVNMLFS